MALFEFLMVLVSIKIALPVVLAGLLYDVLRWAPVIGGS